MNKKLRRGIILSAAAVSVTGVVVYFASTGIAFKSVCENVINIRSRADLEKNRYLYYIQKTRADFPLMNEREELTFSHGKETLQGYLYQVDNPNGIIISAHGINDNAELATTQYQNYFLSKGWDVFSFDMTGCGKSTGKGQKSLLESTKCIKNAAKYVQNYEKTKNLPICLVGYSWGAYGVLRASDSVDNVKAVASFAAFDTANEMMYKMGEKYVTKAALFTKPGMSFADLLTYGDEVFETASSVVKKHKEINYVIAQGDKDTYVSLKGLSTYSKVVDKGLDNVTPILLKDRGHDYPWKTKESIEYISNTLYPDYLNPLREKYKVIPTEELEKLKSQIDIDKASELDIEVMDTINNVFLNSVK